MILLTVILGISAFNPNFGTKRQTIVSDCKCSWQVKGCKQQNFERGKYKWNVWGMLLNIGFWVMEIYWCGSTPGSHKVLMDGRLFVKNVGSIQFRKTLMEKVNQFVMSEPCYFVCCFILCHSLIGTGVSLNKPELVWSRQLSRVRPG